MVNSADNLPTDALFAYLCFTFFCCRIFQQSLRSRLLFFVDVQDGLGIVNNSTVYAAYDYDATSSDELSFKNGDELVVIRRGDNLEKEWWWCRLNCIEGYVPQNYLAVCYFYVFFCLFIGFT
jgi:SH3 domain